MLFQLKTTNRQKHLEFSDYLDGRGKDDVYEASIFSGAEEKFAAARAVSRLHEMTSKTWWDRNNKNA
jgi:cyanate lyase